MSRWWKRFGIKPTARTLKEFERDLDRVQPRPLRGGRRAMFSFGYYDRITTGGGDGGFESTTFRPTVTEAGGGTFRVSWEKGLVDGMEPTIDGARIGKVVEATGNRPEFTVPAEAFNEEGEANVYFRVFFDQYWGKLKVVPVALPEPAQPAPWQTDKLALTIFADGRPRWRALHANLVLLMVNPRGQGYAKPLWGSVV